MKVCQSCGMPMEREEMYGNNGDGSKCDEYCVYCYPKGSFNNPEETFEEMIESCIPFMQKEGYAEAEAREWLRTNLKDLKRWKSQ